MNITRFTDYALRVLIFLGVNQQDSVTIKEVAARYGISKNHLMKVVQELSSLGIVEATRGKNGGIRLKLAPEQINIGKLVRKFEQTTPLVECLGTSNQCIITPACQLKHLFAGALEQFFIYLEQYSLQDLIGSEREAELTAIFSSVVSD